MAKMVCAVVCGIALIAVSWNVSTVSGEKSALCKDFEPIVTACAEEFGVTKDAFLASKDNIDSIDPCFHGCVLKKMGTINDEGMFDPNAAKELHRKYYKGDELEKHTRITDICTSVNSQTVTDGTKGCERAKLVIQCFMNNDNNLMPMTA